MDLFTNGNVFVKPKDPRELAHLGLARKRTFKNVFVKQERGGGDRTCFGAMPCKEEEGEAKIRHIQYPKPNYKH